MSETTLPVSANIPWKPEELQILAKKSGELINPVQVEYFRQLIKALTSMYSEISNVVNNINASLTDAIGTSNGQPYLRLKDASGTYVYIYPVKEGDHYTLAANATAP